jgi:hypothetical protein
LSLGSFTDKEINIKSQNDFFQPNGLENQLGDFIDLNEQGEGHREFIETN